jgi:hypothetical protein
MKTSANAPPYVHAIKRIRRPWRPAQEGKEGKTMRNRIFLFVVLFAVLLAAIAVMVGRREEIKAILGDAVRWFNYFIHVHLPGNSGGQS